MIIEQYRALLWLLLVITPTPIIVQCNGPHANLLAPNGVWDVNPKYLYLQQNLAPAGNILVESGATCEMEFI